MDTTELGDYLRERLGEAVTDTKVAYDQLTVTLAPESLPNAAALCKSDPALAFDFFDFLGGVDERDAGFSVVTHLYSVRHRHHVTLKAFASGGRGAPRLPTLTGVYRGADWHEREAYDMFGIEFDGHPGLLPRILTVENFEGFPLRKEFLLTSREAKPWPGAKEPGEGGESPSEPAAGTTGEVPISQGVRGSPPISTEDKAAAAKAKAERAKAKAAAAREKAAELRRRKAASLPEDQPHGAAEIADTAIAKDAAAGAVQGDVAAGAPGDLPGGDQPIDDPAAEAAAAEGAPPRASAAPGTEAEGRHGGAGPEGGDQQGVRERAQRAPEGGDQQGVRERAQRAPEGGDQQGVRERAQRAPEGGDQGEEESS